MEGDYYSVLGTTNTASKDELKKSYHHLILKYHPDKSQQESSLSSFCKIDEAWKILSDDKSRQEYDAKLKAGELENTQPIHEEINITDMTKHTDTCSYEQTCRCGGLYIVNEEDIIGNNLLVECDNCSLNILVHTCTLNQNNTDLLKS